MKTYSSVEEMQQEYARIRARFKAPSTVGIPQIHEPDPVPVVHKVEIIKLEHKPDFVKTKIWWHEIIDIVEQEVGIPAFEFMSVRRNKQLSDARLLVYALAADCCPHLSLAAIGRLASKDHTTVLKGRLGGRQNPSYQKLKAALLSRLTKPSVNEEEAALLLTGAIPFEGSTAGT